MADYQPRLMGVYREKIIPKLVEKFGYDSVMQAPKIEKVVLNMGVGEANQDSKLLDKAVEDLEAIAGQKAIVTKAKKAISNFKLRIGNNIGCKVTLRRDRMYEFLDRLINIDVPRIRDFRGLSDKSFDGRGNYSLGVKEQLIFPEIDYDKIDKIRGLDISIVTTAKTDQEGYELLLAFGMPFKKNVTEN